MHIDILVLNYNGAAYISDCIRSLLEAVKHSSHHCQILMIDNKSSDPSIRIIESQFPQVKIVAMGDNRVLCAFNDAVAESQAEVVFLLNNDVKADPYFIDPLVSVFKEKKDAFLVAAKSFLFDGSYEGGKSVPLVSFGLFKTTCRFAGFEKEVDEPGITFAAGFGAFDRLKFLELGGFDDLYLPGRLEDTDLAFRAWKKGWKSYYQPKSILYHLGAKSFKDRFGVRGTNELAHRNTFLFMWKNIRSPNYLSAHFVFLIPRLLWALLRLQTEFVTGFWKALGSVKPALARRQLDGKVNYRYSDREIIAVFNHAH